MIRREPLSDEYINAFIDGELDLDERQRFLQRLQEDPDLGRRVCELHTVRDMLPSARAFSTSSAVGNTSGAL